MTGLRSRGSVRAPLGRVGLCLLSLFVGSADLGAQSWKSVAASRLATDEEDLDVRVGYGAGELTLRAAEPGVLYRTVFRFDERWTLPRTDYRNGRLRVDVGRERGRGGLGMRPDGASLVLELSRDVPMEIELDFGSGRADLDLTGLPIRRLEVNTGASESVLRVGEPNRESMESAEIHVGAADLRVQGLGNLNAREIKVTAGLGSVALELDGEWPREARVSVEVGLGALEIRAPNELGVRLRHRASFLASLDLDRFVADGDVHHSVNWDRAERRVDIEVSAALGSIDLIWVN